MTDLTNCEVCLSSRQVRFCRDCTQVICGKCVTFVETPQWSCPKCNQIREGEICGQCGSECQITKYITEQACSSCNSTRLGDPLSLLKNLPSEFFTIISQVSQVNQEIADLFRSFDFLIALVRFCRLAGFLGFPQMEFQLENCAQALNRINLRSVKQLNQIRQEGLYDIRRLDYFSDIDIKHFRNAETVLQATADKIDRLAMNIRHWIQEVQNQIENLRPLAIFLRHHYDQLLKISRHLPEWIHGVVAIISPLNMKINYNKIGEKGDNYIIFAEEELIFLPTRVIDKNENIIGIKLPYTDLQSIERVNSALRGTHLKIRINSGEVIISAPPPVLDRVEEYFGLIYSNEPFMVGSPKKIIQIESDAPDKNEYKRATKKFIGIFRDWLFGDPVQRPPTEKLEMPSMKELLGRLNKLEYAYKDINLRATNLQISPDDYQSQSTTIKNDLDTIKNSLYKLGGHFGGRYDGNYSEY